MNNEQAIETRRTIARAKLQQAIERGTNQAGPVIRRVLDTIPEDSIVRANLVRPIVSSNGQVRITLSQNPEAEGRPLHRNAFGQLCGRLGFPMGVASDWAVPNRDAGRVQVGRRIKRVDAEDNTWRRDLLQHNLGQLLAHSSDRYLVRSVNDQVLGVMSDQYKRYDSRPLLDAFIGACNTVGAVPYAGTATELRASVQAIVPHIFEPVPGECVVYGLSWTNSDFGVGSYGVAAFILRLVCLNGMLGVREMNKVHLGARLPDNLEFSRQTYERETKLMVSATRDIVAQLLNPKALEQRERAVIEAAGEEVDIVKAVKSLGKQLTQEEGRELRDVFERGTTDMVPEGANRWRFANALSWMAQTAKDAGRGLELQEMAGKQLGIAA